MCPQLRTMILNSIKEKKKSQTTNSQIKMLPIILHLTLLEVDEFIHPLITPHVRIFRLPRGLFRFDGAVLNAEECDREAIVTRDSPVQLHRGVRQLDHIRGTGRN